MSEMRRPRAVLSVALALVVVVAIVIVGIAAAGGGGSDDGATATPAPAEVPSGDATPPSLAAFPPAFVDCLADQGTDVASITSESLVEVIHSPEGNACFDVLHEGGGAP